MCIFFFPIMPGPSPYACSSRWVACHHHVWILALEYEGEKPNKDCISLRLRMWNIHFCTSVVNEEILCNKMLVVVCECFVSGATVRIFLAADAVKMSEHRHHLYLVAFACWRGGGEILVPKDWWGRKDSSIWGRPAPVLTAVIFLRETPGYPFFLRLGELFCQLVQKKQKNPQVWNWTGEFLVAHSELLSYSVNINIKNSYWQ